jgi:PAT family beta-lactamase induction signal transducer AmpG
MEQVQQRSPWWWVPSLYFGQGIPYFAVMALSTTMYKNTGISNTDIAFYTSWLYLPWIIKPLWSPLVEMFGTKRGWVVVLQMAIAASLAAVAFTTPLPHFFQLSLAAMWLIAFSSATHDIAADGFYMLGMRQKEQAAYVGVRSTFYRIANVACNGGLTYIAGSLIKQSGNPHMAWGIVFGIMSAVFGALAVYHLFMLPKPADDRKKTAHTGSPFGEFFNTFAAFFRKDGILVILLFLLTFRLGESQLLKMAVPFMLDPVDKGGLGLDTSELGIAYGTIGVIALTIGGLLGGYVISRFGLKRCLWPMAFITHVPDLVFVWLSHAMPENFYLISAAIGAEQFGYGFGFASYLMYMIMVAEGEHKTAHYAICTGFMALGMMVPQMASGWIQDHLGYPNFFIWACMATIPAFIVTAMVKVDPEFGRG